ncbi:MAG: hypothetical protein IPN94_11000 [Sphingobacteriales bacterium]|nr:hypothetical protein [Sphingobacteriales bacterium]
MAVDNRYHRYPYEQSPTYQFNTGNHQVFKYHIKRWLRGYKLQNTTFVRKRLSLYHKRTWHHATRYRLVSGISYATGENLSYDWAVEYNAPNYVTEGTDSIWLCKCDPPNNDTPF